MKDITSRVSTHFTAGHRRYSAPARWLHWLSVLLIFAVIPLGWIFAEFKEPWGGVQIYSSMHKTVGLVILTLIVLRLIWRATAPPPALPGRMPDWEKVASIISHWLLYLIFLAMPISGYLLSCGSKYPITVLMFFDMPKVPVTPAISHAAGTMHIFGQFAVYALVLLHVSATVWHLAVRRDAILDRMLPRQINAE